MKLSLIRLFVVITLIAAVGASAPVQSAEKKTSAKVKKTAVNAKSIQSKSAKKTLLRICLIFNRLMFRL